MNQTINYLKLGGTLFIPASHKNLNEILNNKYPELKSLVIDFEDGLEQTKLQSAYKTVESLLEKHQKKSPYLFLRPKDQMHLKELLKMSNIETVDGFILPKFSLTNAQEYLEVLEGTNFYIMPSIEGKELFDVEKLQRLKKMLLTNKQKILLVRFGLEDMLRQLTMRRGCDESIFDFSVTNVVLGNFLSIFKSEGFAISGGVYPCFKDEEGFKRDVLRDLKEGLFSKTIIHPNQIAVVNELYKVSESEYKEAKAMQESTQVVFNQNGKMAEKHTMLSYSELVLQRAEIYGIKNR
ncbi:HpcH/HpaI aldolase/citrate lyase family protein [Sulfurimonas microaerophilic]|uniref:HpcH/HpaI aldolase/citrate lyase family protein n=1 Tax=Sulfurimonas microaerophilic TaxID=3058392 RepID=UPI002714832A|nr:HpcH/HpaI aldolase/citrate lyase family protein [Sulfurimonas sp. hsl 1-7]